MRLLELELRDCELLVDRALPDPELVERFFVVDPEREAGRFELDPARLDAVPVRFDAAPLVEPEALAFDPLRFFVLFVLFVVDFVVCAIALFRPRFFSCLSRCAPVSRRSSPWRASEPSRRGR